MIDGREDQASGLRRLFRQAPPLVVALYSGGRHRTHNAVLAAHRIAGHQHKVLIVDEVDGEGALAEALATGPGRDLVQLLDGRTTLADVVQPVPGLVGRVPAVAASLTLPLLDEARRACLVEALRILHRHAGFVLIHADSNSEPSPFVHAAPRRLVVAEASASGATDAYRTIKNLAAAGAGSVHLAVCRARTRAEARAFFDSLQDLVRRHVGVPLSWLGEVERDDLAVGMVGPVAPALPRTIGAGFPWRIDDGAETRRWVAPRL